eukprot:g1515.t1
MRLLLLALLAQASDSIDPAYAENLTGEPIPLGFFPLVFVSHPTFVCVWGSIIWINKVYHLNPANFSGDGIQNMDTGDAAGDCFFDVRTVFVPLVCSETRGLPNCAG